MAQFAAAEHFAYDSRLGIDTPDLKQGWDTFTPAEQADIIYFWEMVRGRIPNRVKALEQEIVALQQRLDEEEHFETVCALTWDVADRASRINDLHLLFRLNEDVAVKAHH